MARQAGDDGLVLMGEIVGAHGIRGGVRVRSFTADPMAIGAYGPLSDEAGRRFVLRPQALARGNVVARVDGVGDRNAAEALKGVRLFAPRAVLPPPDEDEYYLADLVGLAADTANGQRIGSVAAVHNFGAGDVLEIAAAEGGAILLPFTRRAVPVVDIAGGRIVVDPPEGSEMVSKKEGSPQRHRGAEEEGDA